MAMNTLPSPTKLLFTYRLEILIFILINILKYWGTLLLVFFTRTFNFNFRFSFSSSGGSSSNGSSSSFLLLLSGSLDVADLGALLTVVHRAAGGEVGLGVGAVLDEGAAGAGDQVHDGPAVRHLLCQPPGLQLDALGGSTEGSERPALSGSVNLALRGGETTVAEI